MALVTQTLKESVMLAMALALGLITPWPEHEQDKKLPVPDASAQKQAEKLIRDIFKDDYAKKGLAERTALARKMLDQAIETKDDPTSRYVLLREARDLAGQSAELDLAFKAVDQIAADFEGEVVSMKVAVVSSAAKAAKTPEEFQKLARSFLTLA